MIFFQKFFQHLHIKLNQRFISIFFCLLYQLLIVPNGIFTLYIIFTLNLPIIGILILISLLQYPIQKSSKFIYLVNKYIQPWKYFSKFQRKYEQKVSKKKCMFCFHPHGIFSYTILLNMNSFEQQMPEFSGLGSRFGYNVPILGLFLRLWGCSTVNKSNIKNLMKKQTNIGLVPGGYEEASITTPKQFRLFLKERKGFIKYALQYNYTIYPVLTFGQHKVFNTLDCFNSLKMLLNKLKIPATVFWSKYLFFINPNIQVTTIVGKGIKNPNFHEGYTPSFEEVNKYHSLYVKEIKRLYKKYRKLNENKPMVIY